MLERVIQLALDDPRSSSATAFRRYLSITSSTSTG
jgi:hypothetical protein